MSGDQQHTAEKGALVSAIAEVLREQMILYTLPANYARPYGNQTHEDVANRCAPLLAERIFERVLSPGVDQ